MVKATGESCTVRYPGQALLYFIMQSLNITIANYGVMLRCGARMCYVVLYHVIWLELFKS